MNQDLLNGCFEFIGSLTIWANVLKLRRDKEVKGTHWEMMIFFACWAGFNLIYYPHLNQMWSLAGATSMFVSEWVWVGLACYYTLGSDPLEMDLTEWVAGMPPQEYFDNVEIDTPEPTEHAKAAVERYHEVVLPERDRSLSNPYSPESILLLQEKYGK